MPKRTNRFQRIVKYLYEQVTPAGGTVTESAMLPETGTGTLREVDILVEYNIAGTQDSDSDRMPRARTCGDH